MKTIAEAALKEAVRKKTFIVMGIVTVLYLVFWTVILYYFQTSAFAGKNVQFKGMATIMVTQMGLQFSSMLLCLLTIMLGAGAVASELESGMVHAILSRPLSRAEYIFGKFLGLALLTILYATVFYVLLLFIGFCFSLSTVTALVPSQLIGGWLMYLLVPLTVLCLTLYGSVTLKVVPNGLLMIFIYILGNIGGMVEMIGNYINNKPVISAGIFISLVSPFHTLYTSAERVLMPTLGLAGEMMRGMGGLTGAGKPASTPMYVYIAVYAVGFLVLSVYKFRKVDIT